MSETIKRACFGSPIFRRKCIVCVIISKGVFEITNDPNFEFIREFEKPLVDKLEELRDKKTLEEPDSSHQMFAVNKDGIRLKIIVEKLSYFKLSQMGIPDPPVPLTNNNAFFVVITLPNEEYYESQQSWSWSNHD